ncbi:MAG: rod shape-determining protein MreD [Ignavibacteria bacterium]|nr:rod shape-determining protein MreD [Ignavibacteria bacterium]
MNFKYGILRNIIVIVLLILIQKTFIKVFSVSALNISPDFVIIALVFIGAREGKITGSIYGFLTGLLADFLSGTFLGLSSLSYTIAAFLAGFFKSENEKFLTKYFFLVTVFACSFAGNFIYYWIYFQGTPITFPEVIIKYVLTTSAYTTIVSIIYVIFPRRKKIERSFLGEA